MSKWPCCFNERGAEVGCSRETVIIDGEEYDLIPYGEGDRAWSYSKMVAELEKDVEQGGLPKLSEEECRERLEKFKADHTPEEYNNRSCHDCGAPMGSIHHLGCDMEECPKCGGQYFVCDCRTAEKEEL